MTAVVEAARKRKPVKNAAPRRENPFIRYELTKDEVTALRLARTKTPDIWPNVDKLIAAGYKVTVSWDDYSSSPTCWLFPKKEHDPNFGAILSGRGRTVENAVFEALYKHYVLFDQVWPRATTVADNEFWDD